ncbi:reverse transcriptase domain, reverse transcriptase zinc-binding domain protein [Tanacetum coccineum]
MYLLDKYPMLTTITLPNMEVNALDQLEWHNELGIPKPFSVATVWSSIRTRCTKVNWYKVVWFASCIPRHAFNFWLVIKQRLKTQDKVARWDMSDSLLTVCPLCELVSNSHEHLFFECPFAQQIWNHMKSYAGLSSSTPILSHIMAIITLILIGNLQGVLLLSWLWLRRLISFGKNEMLVFSRIARGQLIKLLKSSSRPFVSSFFLADLRSPRMVSTLLNYRACLKHVLVVDVFLFILFMYH